MSDGRGDGKCSSYRRNRLTGKICKTDEAGSNGIYGTDYEIEKVQNSKISDADKRKLVAQLEGAITKLQEQYDKEVTEEERKVQEELEGQIESMQEAADEMERQADSLRNVQMDAASTDASAAADAAEAQKQTFENMKSEYVEKLKLQMEQAEIQQRIIRNRRLSGR